MVARPTVKARPTVPADDATVRLAAPQSQSGLTMAPGTHWTRLTLVAILVALVCGASMVSMAAPALAHESGHPIALSLTDERVIASAPVAFTELGYEDTSGDGLIDTDEIRAQEAAVSAGLVAAVRDHVRIEVDGTESVIIGAGAAPTEEGEGDPAEYLQVRFATGPHDSDVSEVEVAWSFTSPSSEVVLSAPDETAAGRLSEDGSASFSLAPAVAAYSFFVSGIDHVRFGPDHLVFLVVLTFAVVGSTVGRASTWLTVKLVTAFTLGHATSLTLAYFDVVSIPAQWVEPAIALSIVAAAVLAIRREGDTLSPWLAVVVGLVHGLGFAGSLSSLGLVTPHHVSALAAFNIGIDVAQTAVVLATVGAIWVAGRLLAERRHWARVAICGAAGVLGLIWTASRLAF